MATENLGGTTEQVETLESEIKGFAKKLPYWEKYLAEKILSGNAIANNDIDTAYSYLLEELSLKVATEKPEIVINYNGNNSDSYKLDLLFTKLENVEGVNALTENQVIEFSPNLTIMYGANGSGKSGYVRLMKKVFYSKTPEEIIPNIHLTGGHKPVNAKFTFNSNNTDIPLIYPLNSTNSEFAQFAVFDAKSVLRHLDQRNEFEFRPAGLSFFSNFTEALKRVEGKLDTEILNKQSGYTVNDFISLFDGESEIKAAIQNLSAQTKIDDLKKYTPFSKQDKIDKEEIEKKYDELLLASKHKEKEILRLENIKVLVSDNKNTIEAINTYFTAEYLSQIQTAITDCINKEATVKAEGLKISRQIKFKASGQPSGRILLWLLNSLPRSKKWEGLFILKIMTIVCFANSHFQTMHKN